MKKRGFIAVLLTMLITVVFSAAVSAETFSDIEDSKYRDSIITLSKLKVIDGYEDGTFKPEGTITRAEFTKMLVCAMGYEDRQYFGNPQFGDIDMWAKNYITTAYGLGIVDGMDDYVFAPNDPVTYVQAQKMMVCALGYVDNAIAAGGWPDGYIQLAGSLKLKNDISGVANDSPAPRGVIAQLMFNSLNVEMKEFKNSQWENTEKTLLKDYLNVVKLRGTLVGVENNVTSECKAKLGNHQMSVKDSSGTEIVISFRDYTQNVTDINKFIGNLITLYYREEDFGDDKVLISIDDETVKNTEIQIKSEDITNYDGNILSYSNANDKRETVRLDNLSASVLYNGKPVNGDVTIGDRDYTLSEAVKTWLTPESENFIYGDVKLTDSGSDGDINFIQIYDYETIVAHEAPKTTDYRITDELVTGKHLILDPTSSDYSFTIQKNGTQIETTSIAKGDVVSYARSLDGELYTVYVTSNSVKGNIETIDDDYIYIKDKGYRKGPMCDEYINKNQSGRTIQVGVTGTFYTDMYNTIVYGKIDTAVETLTYAYICNAVVEESEDAGYILLYRNGATASNIKIKDRVKFNGKTIDYSEAVDRLAETAKSAARDVSDEWKETIYGDEEPYISPYSQPVRVNITKDGGKDVISTIVTIDPDTTGVQHEGTDSIVKYTDLTQGLFTSSVSSVTKRGSFKAGSSSNTTLFSTDDSTTVIYLPMNRTNKAAYASKGFTNNTRYYVEAYDLKSTKVAGLVLVYSNKDNTVTEATKDTNFGIAAKSPEQSYNDSTGETTQRITLFYGPNNSSQTTMKAWQTLSDSEFSDMSVGDVLQFDYDTSNRAKNRKDIMRFRDIADVLDGNVLNNGRLYDWTEEVTPSKDNGYQTAKFDYRYKYFDKDKDEYEDEMYTSGSLSSIYSRACMYNVSQIFESDKKLYVTRNGFDADGSLDDSDYEEVEITSSTKLLRMDSNRKELSRYAEDTTTELTISDLKSAQYYGSECSKILVCSSRGVARLIVIYN